MRETLVGLVFFVLIGLLLGVTLWVNDPRFLSNAPEHTLSARFRDVAGLKVNDEVWLYGTSAGHVTSIVPDGQGAVLVGMTLDRDPALRTDHTLELKPSSALGGMVVAIHPGTPAAPAQPAGVLSGEVTPAGFEGLTKSIEDFAAPFQRTFENLEQITGDVKGGKGLLGRLVYDEEMADRVDRVTRDLSDLSAKLSQGEGTLVKLFTDDTLYKDLEESVALFKKIGKDANEGGGTIDLLLHDEQLARNLQETGERLASLSRKLDDPEGPMSRALDDISLAAGNARDITEKVKSGEGVLGRLVYDDELGDRLDRISRDIAQITGKIRRGEGSLGKLIQDDVLYADLRETLSSLTAGAGDARENAPILTFASFLFGGF